MVANRCLIIVLLLLWNIQAGLVSAQSVTISGYVEDAMSSERILGASVSIPALQYGTTTNQFGFFSLTTEPASIRLLVSHIGYQPILDNLVLTRDTTLIVTLAPRAVRLDDVEVIADRISDFDKVQMSRHEIPIEQIETLPVILGETDIQKTLQLLPSVQSGVEGSSGLYVRGGRADQNLILLDGLPLYNPNHLFGFFSVFNTSAMKRVELIKGGFPARYGGRLSSVINYTMKEGNLKRFAGEGAIGVISSRLMFEGPIVRNRASFLVAGRRSYADQLWRPFQVGRKRYGAAFYDINMKANYILSPRDRIFLSGYAGEDRFSYEERPFPGANDRTRYDLGWHNRLASLRWNRRIGDRMFASTLFGVTQYRFFSATHSSESAGEDDFIKFDQSWHSKIVDWTTKIDFEFIPNTNHYIRFGAEGILHRFSPGSTQTRLDESGRSPINLLQTPTGWISSRQMALYAEDEMQLREALRVTAGIRLSRYFSHDEQFGSIEPRLGVYVRVSDRTAVKASFARSKQYVHLLTGGGVAFPTDLWIPSMDRITPQRGYQVAAGIYQSYRSGLYEVSVEGYLKRMKGHIEYKIGSDRFRAGFLDWPDLIEIGTGASHGAELFIEKRRGDLTGWVGYTWAKTTRQFESLNAGLSFPDGFDRRHDVSVVMQYELSGTKKISAVWVYGSGYPVSAPAGRYVSPGRFRASTDWLFPLHLVDTGPVNTARAPDYHRLDISMHFQKNRNWGKRTFSIGVYNAYNRKNPMFVYPKKYETGDSVISFRQLSLLQLIPAISWQVSF